MYLNKELKEKYVKDFNENVLTNSDPEWKLDDNISGHLIQINLNPHIQTLYSSGGASNRRSYIWFCFSKELKSPIEDFIIPQIKHEWEQELNKNPHWRARGNEAIFESYLSEPEQKPEEEMGCSYKMGCRTDPDFFNVYYFIWRFEEGNDLQHKWFWDTVSDKLSNIGLL